MSVTGSGKIHAIKCDVTDESQVKSAFDRIKSDFGGVDVFISNAGLIKSAFLIGMIYYFATILVFKKESTMIYFIIICYFYWEKKYYTYIHQNIVLEETCANFFAFK